jgi:hypothetical protein
VWNYVVPALVLMFFVIWTPFDQHIN